MERQKPRVKKNVLFLPLKEENNKLNLYDKWDLERNHPGYKKLIGSKDLAMCWATSWVKNICHLCFHSTTCSELPSIEIRFLPDDKKPPLSVSLTCALYLDSTINDPPIPWLIRTSWPSSISHTARSQVPQQYRRLSRDIPSSIPNYWGR